MRIYFLVLLQILLLISGCAKPQLIKLPPVTEGWHKSSSTRNAYIVQAHDTLYSIAWAFGLDYRYLASINHLSPPYMLSCGQRLYISMSKSSQKKIKHHKELAFAVAHAKPLLGWVWPTSGKVIARFNKKLGGNKGLDIAGTLSQSIVACNRGTVVYSGTGISSYGKLIIIKHNEDYLSAYAYNKEILVIEGDEVKTGQKIATMGRDNSGRTVLHFEIRRLGKPIDPILFLPKKHEHK